MHFQHFQLTGQSVQSPFNPPPESVPTVIILHVMSGKKTKGQRGPGFNAHQRLFLDNFYINPTRPERSHISLQPCSVYCCSCPFASRPGLKPTLAHLGGEYTCQTMT